jgi:NADPH:quinone reductase-like Zn-dependent oxidoreductase
MPRGEAWFLYPGEPTDPEPSPLIREPIDVPAPAEDEVLVAPLFGSWEGNMEHALRRRPVDICRQRGEARVVLGNSGVLRVLEVGAKVRSVEPGQDVLLFANASIDAFGYPITVIGFDAPGTVGCLSTRITLKERQVVPLPRSTRHSLARWAAFGVRYFTAWANWELAYGTFRLQIPEDELPVVDVWGWGGGSTLAELELAHRHGCRAVAIASSPERLAAIERVGITAFDRRPYTDLGFDSGAYGRDPAYRKRYVDAERRFLDEVKRRTDGNMVHVFVDYIGSPVFRATLKALARGGVVTTAGWKQGMEISYLRAIECIQRHQLIHTHYARYRQAVAAIVYAEQHDWLPQVDDRIYGYDEIPELLARYRAGETGMFPVYAVQTP